MRCLRSSEIAGVATSTVKVLRFHKLWNCVCTVTTVQEPENGFLEFPQSHLESVYWCSMIISSSLSASMLSISSLNTHLPCESGQGCYCMHRAHACCFLRSPAEGPAPKKEYSKSGPHSVCSLRRDCPQSGCRVASLASAATCDGRRNRVIHRPQTPL